MKIKTLGFLCLQETNTLPHSHLWVLSHDQRLYNNKIIFLLTGKDFC